jgi:hypothetical protein
VAEKRKPDPAWFDFDGLTPDEVEELREILRLGRDAAMAAGAALNFSCGRGDGWYQVALRMLRFQRRVGLAHKSRP